MNRRQFLQRFTAATGALPACLVPLQSLFARPDNPRRLILIELNGGNDGLNTLVPLGNDHYHRLRPGIGLHKQQLISLDAHFALHQALQPLMDLWQSGELAWVHGLGYPQPSRSHFKSIALWETGGDGHRIADRGWLTHDVEHRLGRRVRDAHGISLQGGLNLFHSDSGRWMSLNNTAQLESVNITLPKHTTFRHPYSERTLAALQLPGRRMQELQYMIRSLNSKLSNAPAAKRLSGGMLGRQLGEVARLIRAGIDTPVYRVQLSGFDTHDYQLERHRRLLRQLAQAIGELRKQLKRDNEWHNTLIMTYAEFGRRAAENRSLGTDHGTAAPHLLAGGTVRGGLYSRAPDLGKLIDGDPVFTTDYRALYQQVLDGWFGISDNHFREYKSAELSQVLA